MTIIASAIDGVDATDNARRHHGAQSRCSRRVFMHVFLITVALLWLVPIGTAFYNSFRFYESDTQVNGVFAPPDQLTLQNYRDAWTVGEMGTHVRATRPSSSCRLCS